MPLEDSDLIKMQFDYAWKWFDFHARQRTTMFNFFIIFAGFIFAAISQIFKANDHKMLLVAIIVSCLGVAISFIFLGLDHRNSKLIELGELYLRYFEVNLFDRTKATCFPVNPKIDNLRPNNIGVFKLKDQLDLSQTGRIVKHRNLMPMVFIIVGVVFVGAVISFVHEYRLPTPPGTAG